MWFVSFFSHRREGLLACLVLRQDSQFETKNVSRQLSLWRNRQTNGLVGKKMPRYMTDRQNGCCSFATNRSALLPGRKPIFAGRILSMKCPNCWSLNVQASESSFLHKFFARCFFLVPLSCRHCFHRFHALWWPWKKVVRVKTKIAVSQVQNNDPGIQTNATEQSRSVQKMYSSQKTVRSEREPIKARQVLRERG